MLSERTSSGSDWHPVFWLPEGWSCGTGGQAPRGGTRALGDGLVYVLGALSAGSGGRVSLSLPWRSLVPSGFQVLVQGSTNPLSPEPWGGTQHSPSLGGRVAIIRHYLSLTITDLGRVLRVGRPTVYAWIAETSRPHDDNLTRIGRIYDLARAWRSLSSMPLGGLVREPMDGPALIDLLSRENLPVSQIRRVFVRCAEVQRGSAEGMPRRGLAEALRARGFRPRAGEGEKDSFDQETSF